MAKPTVLGWLFKYVDYRYAMPVIALPLLYGIAWLAGIRAARTELSFATVPSKNLVIVRSYGDIYLCKPLDLSKGQFEAATIILRTDQLCDTPIMLKVFSKSPEVEPLSSR
jgi:hypothetical protein